MTTQFTNPALQPLPLAASPQEMAATRAGDWVAKKCPWCGHAYCVDSACIRDKPPEALIR